MSIFTGFMAGHGSIPNTRRFLPSPVPVRPATRALHATVSSLPHLDRHVPEAPIPFLPSNGAPGVHNPDIPPPGIFQHGVPVSLRGTHHYFNLWIAPSALIPELEGVQGAAYGLIAPGPPTRQSPRQKNRPQSESQGEPQRERQTTAACPPKLLGAIDAQGQFYVTAPLPGVLPNLSGDLFNNPYLHVKTEHPAWIQSPLREVALARARENSMAPWIRATVHDGMGLTGKGVEVYIADYDPRHANQMKAVLQGKHHGIAPDVTVKNLWIPAPDAMADIESEADLKQYLNTRLERFILNLSKQIQTLADTTHPVGDPRRIVIVPMGLNPVVGYQLLYESWVRDLEKHPKRAEAFLRAGVEDPDLRAMMKILSKHETPDPGHSMAQHLYNYVHRYLEIKDSLLQEMLAFDAATAAARQKGIIVVVSAGNDMDILPTAVKAIPTDFVNYLGRSPHVLVAAASDTQQTPEDVTDDRVASFSSWSESTRGIPADQQARPTVAVPGLLSLIDLEPPVQPPSGPPLRESPIDGSSPAASFLGGIVALMVQGKPTLSFDAIKTRLETNAYRPPSVSPQHIGAGFLNPVAALHGNVEAKQRRPHHRATPAFSVSG